MPLRHASAGEPAALERLTIVLVEDNEIDAEVVRRLLRKWPLELPVVRARNGEEALAILLPPGGEETLVAPFVVLLDINMPRMNGFELLAAIADDATLAEVPIFILSTSSAAQDRQTARQYRIQGYFVKPMTRSVLEEVIDTGLSQ